MSNPRIEDIEWMAANGEHITRAAKRVGLTLASFTKYLERHQWRDLIDTLRRTA